MDDELTAISSSIMQVGGVGSATETPDTCIELFDKTFPSYLAMGMTYDEFYNKDHTLTIAYRKAYEKKRKVDNEDMWLQGAYIYEALTRVSPLLIPFAKYPKAEPYLEKPYPIYNDEDSPDEKNAKSNAVTDNKGFAYMQSVMAKVNAKFGKG